MLTAAFTDLVGVHSFLGAFLFGAAVPKELATKLRLDEKLRPFVSWLLLPLFFCVIGIDVHLDAIVGTPMLLAVLLLATLLNCRGLTELVVLDTGRRMGILTDTGFSLFVLMTLVTTAGCSVLAAGFTGKCQPGEKSLPEQDSRFLAAPNR
ncbi:cation:proton antiporter domain-containing protein [Amycolatopsis speibonae]|uniref:Cation:proton antiporter n=1 Tax=Amycolatopsis speibonae TaxID=1450224 RepID=A0ABV7P7A0_9PSEU